MKKWAIAAIIYLFAVIGGYQVYAQFIQKDGTVAHSSSNHEYGEHDETESGMHEHGDSHQSSDVKAKVTYNNSALTITLADKDGNPVDNLEVNHEKIIHLIVVDEGLEKYYHLHPEKTGVGTFQVKQPLENGNYKAFVDIKPKGLNYEVMPVKIKIGEAAHNHPHSLTPDTSLEKRVEGEKVQMKMSSQKLSQPVTLSFSLDKTKLEPYLGAAGHVVILDEKGEHYLHVHPVKENEPVFQTEFDRPGVYKIWAEFKQNGKVRVFPFVVEIK